MRLLTAIFTPFGKVYKIDQDLENAVSSKPNYVSLIWPGIALIFGGLLMAVLWINYIGLHGPTSFNENGFLWGRSPLFWGSMLSGPPSLLVGVGLLLVYPVLAKDAGRLVRIGYILTMIGLLVPAMIDLAFGFIGPPFLLPVFGAGLVLMALRLRNRTSLPGSVSLILLILGILALAGFLWTLLHPLDVFDRLYGYVVYGLMVHFLTGAGWVILGIIFLSSQHSRARTGNAYSQR